MQKTSAFSFLLVVCLASAVQSQIVIAPSTINFGDVQLGQSVEKVAYVINVGDEIVIMSGVGGGLDAPFATSQNCQGNAILPGEECMMFFEFNPTALGPVSAVSQGTWNEVAFNVSVTANVVEPQISIAPSKIDFGTVSVGATAERVVYVTNVGDAPVLMKGVGGGLNGPDFYAVQGCQDNTLSPGESCEILISFTPRTNEPASAVSSGTWTNQAFNIHLTGNSAGIVA